MSMHVSDRLWQVPHSGDKSACVCVMAEGKILGVNLPEAVWRLSHPLKVPLCYSLIFRLYLLLYPQGVDASVSFFLKVYFSFCFPSFFPSPNVSFLLLIFHMSLLFLGCGSDAEAEQVFRMETTQTSVHQNKGYIPPPLRRKQGREENGKGSAGPLGRYCTRKVHMLLLTHLPTADLSVTSCYILSVQSRLCFHFLLFMWNWYLDIFLLLELHESYFVNLDWVAEWRKCFLTVSPHSCCQHVNLNFQNSFMVKIWVRKLLWKLTLKKYVWAWIRCIVKTTILEKSVRENCIHFLILLYLCLRNWVIENGQTASPE